MSRVAASPWRIRSASFLVIGPSPDRPGNPPRPARRGFDGFDRSATKFAYVIIHEILNGDKNNNETYETLPYPHIYLLATVYILCFSRFGFDGKYP
jgi:hypothetical protein